ncbi:DUF4176 domain-containing protein [Listeria innocua]|uniref:DUF4176 domain-containing protein n=1 Tax=Listeria innocua TaxID=1642 RepID=UPI00162772AD|nr:DUF4176 domain-containing protein [Listeria innocua]MBC1925541.1 DUF4176 domain-containing protein [Listeria innocua]
MSKETTLLPLGTAVSIKNDDSKYIIMARAIIKQTTGEMIAKYKAVPHPFGESKSYKTITIAATEITKVEHLGYEDELDKKFIQERLDNAPEQPNSPTETAATPASSTKTVQAEKPLDRPYDDPFYKLRKRGRKDV